MSLAWTIILALMAGPGEGQPISGRDTAWPAVGHSIRATGSNSAVSLSISRRAWHRSTPNGWAFSNLDEFDTEEVDESWLNQLDLIATVPGSWLGLAWSRSRTEALGSALILPPTASHFPLRC